MCCKMQLILVVVEKETRAMKLGGDARWSVLSQGFLTSAFLGTSSTSSPSSAMKKDSPVNVQKV